MTEISIEMGFEKIERAVNAHILARRAYSRLIREIAADSVSPLLFIPFLSLSSVCLFLLFTSFNDDNYARAF